MMKKKSGELYGVFAELAGFSGEAIACLTEILNNFDPGSMDRDMARLHDIEHRADERKHGLMEELAREFIPPIDRQDVVSLAHELDEVTDAIEGVFQRLYMYNVRSVRPEALEMAGLISKGCAALSRIMDEFSNFKRSTLLKDHIIEVNCIEEEGDRLYAESMRRLFTERADAFDALAWSEAYKCFEECFDSLEYVANAVENIVMKNT